MTEEEDESTVYQPLGRKKQTLSSDTSEPASNPPEDTKNFVYLSLLACGIGFVLPYSSFIVAADYWQERFKGKSVALDMYEQKLCIRKLYQSSLSFFSGLFHTF